MKANLIKVKLPENLNFETAAAKIEDLLGGHSS